MTSAFAIEAVDQRAFSDAFDEWTTLIAASYYPLSFTATPTRPFHGRVTQGQYGVLGLSTVETSPQLVRRTASDIARNTDEYVMVSIQTEGNAVMSQDGRSTTLSVGDMAFYLSSRPYHFDLVTDASQIIVQVPVEQMRANGIENISALSGVKIAAANETSLVSRFLVDLAAMQAAAPEQAAAFASPAIPLLATAARLGLGGEVRALSPESHTALIIEQVVAFVRGHYRDPDLTADTIAKACAISRRTLYRLFESDGGIGQLVRQLRVERACALLRQFPDRPTWTVSHQAGFSSERQFFRVFRASVGMTPSEFRRRSDVGRIRACPNAIPGR
ncbi:helix-turn-helix domain-containing protein [Nocardia camponoti]|uniref:AraC family transcriptional regulator n=1 Tax=Nocardia camponoti TaxID=1616106 RepID=A0A917Q9L5_9NOCA|nr:helix-turn-helix domain-containing protein [Nocardia camponoti]GGK37494.1 AraC family transcriptional regulator [Nocardia camponoti]